MISSNLFNKKPVAARGVLQRYFMRYRPIVKYLIEYAYFTGFCFLKSMDILLRKNFDVLHLHNPPDTLFVIAGFLKLFGKKIVFDHHDLSPELFAVRFGKGKSMIKNVLIMFEGLSCRLADALICTNESYKEIDRKRHGIDEDKIFIVRNNPNLISMPQNGFVHPNKTPTFLYIGSINPQDGVDLLIAAVERLIQKIGKNKFRCIIVGDGDSLRAVKTIAKERGLEKHIHFYGYVFERETIFQLLQEADICVEPAPGNELNHHSTFIKLMEYMSAGKPIVAFDLKESRATADGAAIFVKNKDIDGFASAMQCLLENQPLRSELGTAGRERIESELNWKAAAGNLIKAYASLS